LVPIHFDWGEIGSRDRGVAERSKKRDNLAMDAIDRLMKETQAGPGAFLSVMLGFLLGETIGIDLNKHFIIAFFAFMGFGFMVGAFIPKKDNL